MGRQHRALRRYHHVPGHCRPHAKRNLCLGTADDEDQNHRATRTQVLCLDWRQYFGFFEHLPTDVDQQARIRRVWTVDCPPKMLLSDGGSCKRESESTGSIEGCFYLKSFTTCNK